MNILYIGDIMAKPGIQVVEQVLPDLLKEKTIDLVIAQAENVSDGKSMTPHDMELLIESGIDFFTGGNHTPRRTELHELLLDSDKPVVGPANMHDCPGNGWKYVDTPKGRVLVISILGKTFGNNQPIIDNPLRVVDSILHQNIDVPRQATVVNIHGDYSSEKRVMGYYLDGRVTAVIGDHWHVPTADAMILPRGTAHITDVGMCGTMHSSLGVRIDSIVRRWRDDIHTKNEIESSGPYQFNAVLVNVKEGGLASSIDLIQRIRD